MVARLFVEGSCGKKEITLGRKEAHYLRHVLRLKEGDRVIIFDGEEGEGYIRKFLSPGLVVEIKKWSKIERELPFSLTLGQALLKGDKMDMVIEKAAEIGASSIIPLLTERVVAKAGGLEKQKRWNRISCEAARLSGRLKPPEISRPLKLNDFLEVNFADREVVPWADLKVVPWEEEKEVRLFNLLKKERSRPKAITVILGPEGGLSKPEIILLRRAGFETVSLGLFIVRSETAAIYALSCITGFLND